MSKHTYHGDHRASMRVGEDWHRMTIPDQVMSDLVAFADGLVFTAINAAGDDVEVVLRNGGELDEHPEVSDLRDITDQRQEIVGGEGTLCEFCEAVGDAERASIVLERIGDGLEMHLCALCVEGIRG